ncbi:MAG: acetylglutamate kinase [Polyangiaceae bacterium]
MRELIEKAFVLTEALPYIRRFSGATFVVKYGGHAMSDVALAASFARDIALLKYVGIQVVVVHGGGPQIDATLDAMGIKSERVDGLRVTDERTMEVAEMVLCGRIRGQLVSLLCASGARAVGFSGRDDGMLLARRMGVTKSKSGAEVDLGLVGEMTAVRADLLDRVLTGGFVPVVSPVAVSEAGEPLNVNADYVAGWVASALRAEKLVLMTDVEGVRDANGRFVSSLDVPTAARWIDEKIVAGGMIPKIQCASDAISRGVGKVHIIDGRMQHAVLLEIFTDRGVGTEIVAKAMG